MIDEINKINKAKRKGIIVNNNYKMGRKAQMKIQEMAFVLIAIVIFFAMVALVYFMIRISSMREDASILKEESAREIARKLSDVPEFSWAKCSGCIDADKIFAIKDKNIYKNLWNLNYLAIEKIYPAYGDIECTSANYPNCKKITLIGDIKNKTIMSAFVALCRYESSKGGYEKCELGKIYASQG